MVNKKKLLTLEQMEPIARDATREALKEYPPPPAEERAKWSVSKIEGDFEGIFEIYIPDEISSVDVQLISCARVNRETGAVSVEIFLDKE